MKDLAKNHIVNISISCDDINKKSEFMNFTENIIKIYAPEENIDEILKSFDNSNGLSTAESDWYSYLLVENEKGIYLSVNNNKLNPQSLPEYSLKTNENIENKKRIDEFHQCVNFFTSFPKAEQVCLLQPISLLQEQRELS